MEVTTFGGRKTKTLYTFDGIGEYVEFANANKFCNSQSASRVKSRSRNEWAGGTYQDAVEQAKTGNPELVQQFYDGVNELNAMIEQDGEAYLRDVTGEFFDVGDYLSGEPECWWRNDSLAGKRQVVPVYVNTVMSCWLDKEYIVNRGVAVLALCDMLQKHGFIVDLNIVAASDLEDEAPGKGLLYQKVLVKNDPIDLDMLAFLAANPLFLRRLFFSVIEIYAEMSHVGGYGHPKEYDLPDLFETGISGFYFTTNCHSVFHKSNYKTIDAAKQHVMDMIVEFQKNEKQVIFG